VAAYICGEMTSKPSAAARTTSSLMSVDATANWVRAPGGRPNPRQRPRAESREDDAIQRADSLGDLDRFPGEEGGHGGVLHDDAVGGVAGGEPPDLRAAFEVDVDQDAPGELLENLPQGRDAHAPPPLTEPAPSVQRLGLRERHPLDLTPAVGGPIHPGVVDDDDRLVPGQAHVDLQDGGALGHRELEGRQRVLGSVGAGAPMGAVQEPPGPEDLPKARRHVRTAPVSASNA
jgi:hypothetical protein